MTSRSIVPDLKAATVWFLTGSQGLYGEETLRQVAEQSQAVAAGLAGSSDISVTVEWRPVLTDSASIRRAMLEANADDSVIGVIAWMHTFSPAKMWIAGLDALQKPLLHLHTQANVALPWGEIDFDFMNLNQAAHGDREFGYIESRLNVPRTTVVGHVSDPASWAGVCPRNHRSVSRRKDAHLSRTATDDRRPSPVARRPSPVAASWLPPGTCSGAERLRPQKRDRRPSGQARAG